MALLGRDTKVTCPLGGTAVSETYFWDFRDWLKEKLGEDLELLPSAGACKIGWSPRLPVARATLFVPERIEVKK
jgi:hypothetical protein